MRSKNRKSNSANPSRFRTVQRFGRWPTWLMYSSVAVVSAVYFSWLQFTSGFTQLGFADPDSFYHTRFAVQLSTTGLPDMFPWLQFTTLADKFTDLHLLYHVLLWPFVTWLDPAVGAKVLQVLLLVGLSISLLAILRRWRVPYAPFAILVLYTVWPFVIRINLVKATALAMIILLWIVCTLLAKRYRWVIVLTALYTWAHAGFILALITATVIWFALSMATSARAGRLQLADPRGVIAVCIGIIFGIVINPYFPANVGVYWQQVVQIGLVNYQSVVGVGAEWYAYPLSDLVGTTSLLMIVVICGLVLMIRQWAKYIKDPVALSLWLLAVIFFVATLRSRRFVEYFVPFMGLWAMYVVLPYLESGQWRQDWRRFYAQVGKIAFVLTAYLLITLPLGAARAVWLSHKDLQGMFPISTYQAASEYIATHAQPGDTVFHVNWDEFPMLYYHNPNQYYIVGLDATFMYLRDPDLYQRWRSVAAGELKSQSAQIIMQEFGAQYVFIDRQDKSQLLNAYLYRDPNVELVFEDDNTRVYYSMQDTKQITPIQNNLMENK